MKVLVVDHESGVRKTLVSILGEEGYSAAATASAQEGLERALEDQPEFIIFDARELEMTEAPFIEKLRESGIHSLVLVTYSYGSRERVIKAMRAGAYDCLPKPFTTSELVITMDKALLREEVRKAGRSNWG